MSLQEIRRMSLHPIEPETIFGASSGGSADARPTANRGQAVSPHFTVSDAPLYRQLSSILKEQILSGALAPGDQLPTEAMLVDAYQVSRITVRQALKILAGEGLIRREAGRGTFVLDNQALPDAFCLSGSMDDLIAMDRDTDERLLDLRQVMAESKDERTFGLGEDQSMMRCERLRYLRNEPFSHSVSHFPMDIAQGLQTEDWQDGSIFRTAQIRLGVRLCLDDQTIRATLADATLAQLLRINIGSPLLAIERLVRTDFGRPVARVSSRYRADIFSLNVQLGAEPKDLAPGQ